MNEVVIPELRRNSPYGHWRLYAAERKKRPHQPDKCPFCPVSQNLPEPVLFQIPSEGEWQLLVVPNKYPALRIEGRPFRHDGGLDIRARGPWQRVDGTGAHEVIVESRRHDCQFHEFPVSGVADVLYAASMRYHDLKGDRRFNHFFLFRNTGLFAGMSLTHPHWQIFVSVVPAEGVAEILNEYRRYHEAVGGCLYCDHVDEVLKDKDNGHTLFIAENDGCVAFVPYAPEFLNEVWIVPKREFCNCSFAYPIRDSEKFRRDVAQMLLYATRCLSALYGDRSAGLSYNIAVHTAPYFDDRKDGIFHWHIRILPRGFTTDGSIEVATKLPILPSLPEEWAKAMRMLELRPGDIQ